MGKELISKLPSFDFFDFFLKKVALLPLIWGNRASANSECHVGSLTLYGIIMPYDEGSYIYCRHYSNIWLWPVITKSCSVLLYEFRNGHTMHATSYNEILGILK